MILLRLHLMLQLGPAQPYFMGVWSIVFGLFVLDTAAKVEERHRPDCYCGDAMSAPIAIEPLTDYPQLIDDFSRSTASTSVPCGPPIS